MKESSEQTPIPYERLASPARRALVRAGYQHLEQLTAVTEVDIAALHGIGPNALATLRQILAEQGLSF